MRVVRPDGSGGRDVVTTPGHYVEPSFSPDGKSIVYRHSGGDSIRGPVYAEECRATLVSTCTGPAMAAVSTGRWGRSSSRAT